MRDEETYDISNDRKSLNPVPLAAAYASATRARSQSVLPTFNAKPSIPAAWAAAMFEPQVACISEGVCERLDEVVGEEEILTCV